MHASPSLLARLAPVPTEMVFCLSLALGGYLFASVAVVAGWHPPELLAPYAVGFEYVVAAVQAATGIYVAYLAWFFATGGVELIPRTRLDTFIVALLGVALVLVVVALIEGFILKPSFGAQRPDVPALNEMTGVYGWLVSMTRGPGTGAPSGFTTRQLILSLWIVLLSTQRSWPRGRPVLLSKGSTYAVAIGSFVLVVVCRVLSGAHYPFDIAIGIGFGVFLFWWTILMLGLIVTTAGEFALFARRFMIPGGFFTIVHGYLSNNLRLWAIFSSSALVLLAWAEQRQRRPR